jgi:hypothetical protein
MWRDILQFLVRLAFLSVVFWPALVLRSCAAGPPRPLDLETRP